MPQGTVLEPLLFIYIFELFYVVGNYIVGHSDDSTIYAVIPRQISRTRLRKSLNQDLSAINSLCWKWPMRLKPKKTKSMLVSRSHTIAPGYSDLTHGGAWEVKCLHILWVEFAFIELSQKQSEAWVSYTEQENYLFANVCSRAFSMHMFCPAWSIMSRMDVVGGVSVGLLDSIVRSEE